MQNTKKEDCKNVPRKQINSLYLNLRHTYQIGWHAIYTSDCDRIG